MPADAAVTTQQSGRVYIGIDIGGTFTDIVVLSERGESSPELSWTKVPSTPGAPADGVIQAVQKGLARASATIDDVAVFMHASTVATNAVLEEKGARIGVIATEGFEDALEIGRQKRSQMYVLQLKPETPGFLCPAARRLGVPERISFDGEVLKPLDEAKLRGVLQDLAAQDVEAIAVCYLFSFQNNAHELRTREIASEEIPGVAVSLSHQINPVFREYERVCVTAFDAYLRPVMERYITLLTSRLKEIGLRGLTQTMKSRGGLSSLDGAIEQPVTTMLSGPAAGVVGARVTAQAAGLPNIITLDMGGTSSDIALIQEGRALTSTNGKIRGYPLSIPMVDVETIGAGGGSVAWLDAAGGLRVGPHSAGADPGPACYGRGGSTPTVTDASVVLGYLDPDYFAGGDLRLDAEAAHRVIEPLAEALGMTVEQAAFGIHRIVNAKTADAIRLASIKRGYDPRDFALLAFGGAGPVHGAAIAAELGMGLCVVPQSPGVLSALGLMVSDVEYDAAHTFLAQLPEVDLARGNAIVDQLADDCLQRLTRDGYRADECTAEFFADARYVGQSNTLEIEIAVPLDEAAIEAARRAFHSAHDRVYGHAPADAEVELVNLRGVYRRRSPLDIATPLRERIRERTTAAAQAGSDDSSSERARRCYFGGTSPVDTPVYDRSDIRADQTIVGPAVLQQEDSTIVVYPSFIANIDHCGDVHLAKS